MTESERAVGELLAALRNVDIERAKKAAVALQVTRTIGLPQARQLTSALRTIEDVLKTFGPPG